MTIGISWLRARLGHLMVPEGQADTLLYVSRADAAQRHILNEGELEDSLARLGFKSFVPGRCNVAEQIRAFSSARVIVGVHGAGMTNMVYAPAHASYIEIVSGALATMDDFRRIASAREQAMTTIVSESYALGQEVHANADYFVDVAAVVKAAQAALSRSE
jgi:capsular polysaccharide biosynthesis protein